MSEEEILNLKVMVSNLDLSIDSKEKLYNQIIKISFLLEQKENIIKEAINYIKEESWFCYKDNEEVIDRTPINKLLEILGDNDENI